MVLMNALLDDRSMNFSKRHDLPTPESPTMTNLKVWLSSLELLLGHFVLLLRVAFPLPDELMLRKLIFPSWFFFFFSKKNLQIERLIIIIFSLFKVSEKYREYKYWKMIFEIRKKTYNSSTIRFYLFLRHNT